MNQEQAYPPPAGQRVWDWFWEIEKGRQAGFSGASVMSWSDMAEWQRITGANPELWELNALRRMEQYRIDPDYDPAPKKEEPRSIIRQLQAIKDTNK